MASTFINKDEILRKIKLLLSIKSDDYDEKLKYLIDLITDEVSIYTNISNSKLPSQIENIIVDICTKYLKVNNFGIEDIAVSDTKSIKRGDTAIEFNTSNILTTMKSVGYIEQELKLLNHFKRVKMR
ncbi:Phage gp6-like head-tail connector protein [Peptoanaerobacter stomatis]|uniref:Phage gp6-like head-tail connector protein n=1 Tax=Peptoanaerobacter stomatis TaxID=796937 RepID=J6HEM3_9FIRM|nr:phage head-tail connector protein [Peptoanaerobacter stomatis]EJU21193.1 Phage gp6-like head-tail connector protein [Peptoanaerobacter stomatis]